MIDSTHLKAHRTAASLEPLFEVLSQRYEHGATAVTGNLPFDEWTSVFGSERLTGALLDRLTTSSLTVFFGL
jgi:DNA replication protein DnaC